MKEAMSACLLDAQPIDRRFEKTEVNELCDLSNIRPTEVQMKTAGHEKDPILTELIKTTTHLFDWNCVSSEQTEKQDDEQQGKKKKTLLQAILDDFRLGPQKIGRKR